MSRNLSPAPDPTGSAGRRRRRWLLGVAGLTGVISLAAAGTSAGAAGLHRFPGLDGSSAHQSGDGHRRDDRGGPAPDEREDRYPRAKEVPCDPNRLIAAITRANAEHGGTLKLARDCTYTLTAFSGPNGLPPITQPIEIVGEHSTLVRAANAASFRFFEVDNGGELTLRDVTLKGGQANYGGALWVRGGGRAEIVDSTLVNNTAQTTGGAIQNEGTVSLHNSSVERNNAGLTGGAVHSGGRLEIGDSRITYNNAGAGGGGINTVAGSVQIWKSAVTNNRAILGGAGIGSTGGIISLTHVEVADNVAGGAGGGIGVAATQLALRDVTLARNTAGLLGGGGLAATAGSNTVVEKSKVARNTTGGVGGGISNSLGSQLVLRESEVVGNQAANGGGIDNAAGTVVLSRSKVVDNTALTAGGIGGIRNVLGTVTINPDSTVVANRPTNCGPTPIANCFG
ncbi:right-handed parallel beta-helix repeat-containing protein [Micromonospora sp. NPDC051925]|uniref:right-handed parallel beta-helix repeat-containing protein n=1 Tax=Micromonospora sp. NPDC051925 TaxID=3364288 RepID=UPI0037CA3F29